MSVPRGAQLLQRWFPHTTTPFIANAPMLGHVNATLAAAVVKAGGLGFIAGGKDFSDPKNLVPLSKELAECRRLLDLQKTDPLPIGVGFLTFDASAPLLAKTISPLLEEHKPAAVWLFAPSDPSPHATLLSELKQRHTDIKLIVQVGSVKAAREAANDGASVIVAQGIDAGGHQWHKGAGIVSLVPEIRDMLQSEFPESSIALLAAGGIVDGRGIAAALTLGADGVVMGTRFVVSKEAPVKDDIKQLYLRTADGGATTIKSTLHDDVRGTGFWPSRYDGRALVGNSYNDLEDGMSMEDAQRIYKEAVAKGDTLSRAIVWSGTGVGLIKDIKSVKDIIKEAQALARSTLQQAASWNQ